MPASEPPLGGASFAGLVRVAERAPSGRIALKADLGSEALARALGGIGLALPGRLCFADGEGGRAAWMAPDELLLSVPPERAAGAVAGLDRALGGEPALVADVSDARAAFEISGAAARDVLAKCTPAPVSAEAFPPGGFRRTRLAQVAGAVACERGDRFEVLVWRSVAAYAFDLLRAAADPSAPLGLHPAELSSAGA